MRVGWDVSDRPATFGFGRVVVDEAAKRGVELRSDHNGLHVYPEQAIVRFASGQVNAVVTSPLKGFLDDFAGSYRSDPAIDDDLGLALEIFGLSFFEGEGGRWGRSERVSWP